jgi:hemolysin D
MTADIPVDHQSFSAGQLIFREGQPSTFAFLIVSGSVVVTKGSPKGKMRLATLGAGEMFGEMGILDGSVRSATATAGEDTVLRAFDKPRLLALLAQQPETAIDLIKAAARRLRHTNSLIIAPETALMQPKRAGLGPRLRRFFVPDPLDLDLVRIEFQPDAIEIEERPLPFGAKAILHTVVALVICSTIWASIAKMDLIVVANGRISTTDAKIVVQPMTTAAIRSIGVHQGQIVDKGQVLVSLDATFAAADEHSVHSQTVSSAAEIARLDAELALPSSDTGTAPKFSDEPDEQLAQAELFRRHAEARRSMVLASDTEIRELDHRMTSLRSDRSRAGEQMATAEKMEAIRRELHSHGTGSLISLLESQRQLATDKREMERITNEIGETAKKIDTIRAKLAAGLGETAAKTAQDLQAARRDYTKASEQSKKQQRLSDLIDLRSPAKAMVLEMGERSVGSVVKEGEQLVVLVPLNGPLEIDASVDPKDISHLRAGDTARVKLDAFPYQKYGTLDGTVQSVNGDVTERDEAGRKVKVYRVKVAITKNNLHDVPADAALLPGMAANCEIKVGNRRLITYFLYPIIRTLDSALREP